MTKRTDKMKNLWMKIKREPERWMFWAALLGFLASMVPVWALSFYTVPGCDDYTYGVKTHGAWKAAGTLTAVLQAALETTAEYWQEWQGTYSSIFLMTLSPGILDEKWYFLTVFLMTGMLGFGLWALLHVVLKKCAGCGSACRRGLCVLLLLFLCFQTMVAPADGEVSVVMEDSRHACGLTLENGMEVLIHVGIDTVNMQGEGFELLVKQGQKVRCGQPLLRFDPDKIQAAGYPIITVFVVTDEGDAKDLQFVTGADVKAGETDIVNFQ